MIAGQASDTVSNLNKYATFIPLVSSIKVLYLVINPTTVLRRIVAIVVYAIKGEFWFIPIILIVSPVSPLDYSTSPADLLFLFPV